MSMGSFSVGAAKTGGMVSIFLSPWKALVYLVVPLEVSGLLHESVEGESFLSESADEAVQGCQASDELPDVS